MKNRITGFCRLHQDNLGLISAPSLQTAECGCGLLLSIWQDQIKVISSNLEKVPQIYAKKPRAWCDQEINEMPIFLPTDLQSGFHVTLSFV